MLSDERKHFVTYEGEDEQLSKQIYNLCKRETLFFHSLNELCTVLYFFDLHLN